jgi:glycosyltransferase involved in cell wall biosynthesis
MTVSQVSGKHVAILVFPFAAQNVLSFASKHATAVSVVAADTILVGGRIPDNIDLPIDVKTLDIGVHLHYLRERRPTWLSLIQWVDKALLAQIRLAQVVFQLRHQVDVIICFMGVYYQLPILVARLLNKKVLGASWGIYSFKARLNYGNIFAAIIDGLARLTFSWCHGVLVDSLLLANHQSLAPFRSKVYDGALFLENPHHFQVQTPVQERENFVGFIGRLVVEKGAQEFLQAIPLVLEQQPDLQFLVIGTGRLDESLSQALEGQPWASRVTRLKWVDHERMPDYLNRLKLLVVPSLEEGLPNLIMEAMGCGTPVLATGVGGIPDLIKDGETGFLLKDNSPDTIAEAILRAVKDSRLENITQQARTLIERNYTLDAASKRYRAILEKLDTSTE